MTLSTDESRVREENFNRQLLCHFETIRPLLAVLLLSKRFRSTWTDLIDDCLGGDYDTLVYKYLTFDAAVGVHNTSLIFLMHDTVCTLSLKFTYYILCLLILPCK